MAFWITLLIWVGTTVLGELLRPRASDSGPKASGLGDFNIPTADETRAIPIVCGTVLVKGPNVVWYGDLKVVPITRSVPAGPFGLFSDTVTIGYRYLLGMQLALCHGLVDAFRSIRFGPDGEKTAEVTTTASGDHLRVSMGRMGFLFSIVNMRNLLLFGGDEGEGGVAGEIDFYYGSGSQDPNDYLEAAVGTALPAYRTLCYAVLRRCYLGTSPYLKEISIELSRFPNTLGLTGGKHIIATYDCNPAAFVYDLMLDPVAGLGLSSGLIDVDSFQAAGNALAEEGLGLSLQWTTATPARQIIDEVLRHIDGVIFESPVTGLLTLRLARADYVVDDLPVLDASCVRSLEFSRPSWSELSNVVRARFVSRVDGYTDRVAVQQNLSAIETTGGRVIEDLEFMGLSTWAGANRVAARELKSLSYPLARATLKVNRKAWQFAPCTPFVLNWPPLGIEGMVLRVTNPHFGELEAGEITLDCVEDVFSISPGAFTDPGGSGWIPPTVDPLAVAAQTLIEAPYHLVGAGDLYVLAAAARAAGSDLGYEIWSDPAGGTAYALTNRAPAFAATGALVSALAENAAAFLATGFTVQAAIDVDELEGTDSTGLYAGVNLALIGSELFSWQDLTDNGDGTYTFTNVVRAVLDTVQAYHAAGARVWFLTPGRAWPTVPNAPYPADLTVAAKLLPFNANATLPIASATALSLTTASRAQLPYPPGKVEIDGTRYPASISHLVDHYVTWRHRNRVTQFADRRVLRQDDGTYAATPEGDYTIEVRVGGSLVRTAAAVTGTTWTWSTAMQAADGATAGASVSIRVIPVNGSLVGTYQERSFTMT